jgi:hypothetical protein
MKDAAGDHLAVGMHVWANNGGYVELIRWRVTGFTPKKVRLLRDDADVVYEPSNRSARLTWYDHLEVLKSPSEVLRALSPSAPTPNEEQS